MNKPPTKPAMVAPAASLPERFERIAGPLPAAGAVPDADRVPFQTVQPAQERFPST